MHMNIYKALLFFIRITYMCTYTHMCVCFLVILDPALPVELFWNYILIYKTASLFLLIFFPKNFLRSPCSFLF